MADVPEVWLPVIGYAGLYEASNHGRVRNCATGRVLKSIPTAGYCYITLYRDKDGGKTHYLHLAVLSAFCGPAPFDGAEGCHNDGNKGNNALTNLRWGTSSDNAFDRKRHGTQRLGVQHSTAKLTDEIVLEMRDECRSGTSAYALAKKYGVTHQSAWRAITGQTWRHVEGALNNG